MGYYIYIGELVPDEDEYAEQGDMTVHEMEHENAPQFPGDAMTGKTNGRHPSYIGWSRFLEEAGLPRKFCVEEHPGWRRLTASDLSLVKEAVEHLRTRLLPGEEPGFDMTDTQAHLARALWLEFWIEWALNNCKEPAVCNG